MLKHAHRQKLTVPNSLALAAAAVLVWSANGSSTELKDFDTTCNKNASVVVTQQSAAALPSMRATPNQCSTITALQPGDAVVSSVRDAVFRLLYLPAKVLLHH